MAYCTNAQAYSKAGISSTEISEADMTEFVLDAEVEVDRITQTTHWHVEASGTADSANATSLTDAALSLTVDANIGDWIWIYGGTGSGQLQEITDNTATVVTVAAWNGTTPDNTSTFRIIHTGTTPDKTDQFVGSGTPYYFIRNYPLRILESVTINSTSQTVANLVTIADRGELLLTSDTENSRWDSRYDMRNTVVYQYGVYPFERMTQRLTAVIAAMMALTAQTGGTFNDPTSYGFPEVQIGLGEPFTNIRETITNLKKEYDKLTELIDKYPTVYTDNIPSSTGVNSKLR